MLRHDCHSIVAGTGHADAMIETLKGYIEKGQDTFSSILALLIFRKYALSC